MDKVFIDTDVLLDIILDRKKFVNDSQTLFALAELNIMKGYTSTLILANCYYVISSKLNSLDSINVFVEYTFPSSFKSSVISPSPVL